MNGIPRTARAKLFSRIADRQNGQPEIDIAGRPDICRRGNSVSASTHHRPLACLPTAIASGESARLLAGRRGDFAGRLRKPSIIS
jgi:hypothetical protein